MWVLPPLEQLLNWNEADDPSSKLNFTMAPLVKLPPELKLK